MNREEIIRKMQEAGLKAPARGDFIFIHWDQIAMLLDHERAAERDACECIASGNGSYSGEEIAAAIRARGMNEQT